MPSATTLKRVRLFYPALLTLFALPLHGFHPYAEDGGVYLPGIQRLLNPALYGVNPAFVLAPMRTSLFAPFVAYLVRATHISLPWMLLLLHALSFLLALYAAAWITTVLTPAPPARDAAVTLLACWLTLPVAGTSLLLMDPYLTARSLCTPLLLLALGFSLRHRWGAAAIALAIAATFHPLMAGFGLAAVASIAASAAPVPQKRLSLMLALAACALILAASITALSPAESSAYCTIAMSRFYWFLSQWRWYELAGLLAPLLLLLGFTRGGTETARTLARAALLLGSVAILIALFFSSTSMPTHLLASLQPLRAFQVVYFVMILRLGVWLGQHVLRTSPPRWALMLVIAATPLGYGAHHTYPNSNHFELPSRTTRNPWQQAFVWISANTPADALFAIDAFYITQGKHEDAQTFRALAQRNVLPDYSKDGGEASIAPQLTAAWTQGVAAQTGLNQASDPQRLAALHALHPTWAVLQTSAETRWYCPYRNAIVKVCALPAWTP